MGNLIKSDSFFVRQESIKLHGKETTCYFDKSNDTWFEAREQCEKLGLSNVTRALNSVPERGKIKLLVQLTSSKLMSAKKMGTKSIESVFINEGGLNMLILKSKKPEAMKYKEWIAFDLLPMIRKLDGHSIGEYKEIRLDGIQERRLETDVIKDFIAYAIADGASKQGASMYYSNITKEINKQLQIKSREEASPDQLLNIKLLERAVKVSLARSMNTGVYFKTAYELLKYEVKNLKEILEMN